MILSVILKYIFSLVIFAKSTIYAEEVTKILLILKDQGNLEVRTFWNRSEKVYDASVVDSMTFREALLQHNYRSPYIDTWDVYSPYKIVMGAYNLFGDVLWQFSFDTVGSTSQLSSWLTNARYLHSYPDEITQSTISFSLNYGISVIAGSSDQLTTLLNVSMATGQSSIVIFTDEVPEFVPPYQSAGCYHYTSVSVDASTKFTDTMMDVEVCLQACTSNSASTHFMIEYRNFCSCGTMVHPDRLIADSQCLYRCPGNEFQSCGGVSGIYNVYSKNVVASPLFQKTDEEVPSSSITYLESNLHQINNSAGIPFFIDGIAVTGPSDMPSIYSLYYSPDFCTLNSSLEGFYKYQDNNSLTEFPANGSLIPLPLLPYSCVRLAMTSATWKVDSISVTLYYPDKYTNAPFFVIEGVYASMTTEPGSTTGTMSTSSEAQTTTTMNEMSSAATTMYEMSTAEVVTTSMNEMSSVEVITTNMNKMSSAAEVLTTVPKSAISTQMSVTVQNTNPPLTCLCNCYLFPNLINWNLLSPEEKRRMMILLIDDLRLNKKNLSSTIRRKSSASDERKSAAAIGCVGIVILSIVFGLLVIPDCFNFLHYVFKSISKKCKTTT